MAKKLRDIIKKTAHSKGDEKFIKAHKVDTLKPDAPTNKDDQFETDVEMFDRHTEHGYNPGEDEAAYDSFVKEEELNEAKLKHLGRKNSEAEKAYSITPKGGPKVRVTKWKDGSWSASSDYGHDEITDGGAPMIPAPAKSRRHITNIKRKAIQTMIGSVRTQANAKKAYDSYVEEDQLNELTGKGKIRSLVKKTIKVANTEFWKGKPGGKAAPIRATSAAAKQADALDMASSSIRRKKSFWLNKAKEASKSKKNWQKRIKEEKEDKPKYKKHMFKLKGDKISDYKEKEENGNITRSWKISPAKKK